MLITIRSSSKLSRLPDVSLVQVVFRRLPYLPGMGELGWLTLSTNFSCHAGLSGNVNLGDNDKTSTLTVVYLCYGYV